MSHMCTYNYNSKPERKWSMLKQAWHMQETTLEKTLRSLKAIHFEDQGSKALDS